MGKRIVVIGASAASIAFITKLRTFDKESEIVCFSGETYRPYNRCFLADFMTQEKQFDDMKLKPDTFFEDQCVDLRLGTWITSVDCSNKVVAFGGGQLSYDYLFIGIGTKPFYPPVPGIDTQGVFGFHAFDDVNKIDLFLREQQISSAVVVGGGINGLEAASSLVDRGLQVALVEIAEQVMPGQTDKTTASYVRYHAQEYGLQFFLGQSLQKIEERNNRVFRVQLSSGAFLPTDCVVFATGNRMNTDLVVKAGLKMHEQSLVISNTLQTSDPFIFAGGDICAAPDMVSKDLVRSATWPDAMLQGLCAATQFSDKPRMYPGVVGMRDSYFFGKQFYACGKTVEQDDITVIEKGKKDWMYRFYMQDNCLKGFVLLGKTDRFADYKRLYMTQCCVEVADL